MVKNIRTSSKPVSTNDREPFGLATRRKLARPSRRTLLGSAGKTQKPPVMHTQATDAEDGPNVPSIHTALPPIRDDLITETSVSQDETIEECLPFLAGIGIRSLFDYNQHGIPSLDRAKHIEYLHDRLGELPPAFVAYDAARPWLLYWTLTGLCLLGEDVGQYRSRYSTSCR